MSWPNKRTNRTCTVLGCTRKHYALDLCNPHYQQFRTNGEITLQIKSRSFVRKECRIEGCTREAIYATTQLCNTHYGRLYRYGDPTIASRKEYEARHDSKPDPVGNDATRGGV